MNDNSRLLHLICIILLSVSCMIQQIQIDRLNDRCALLEESSISQNQKIILEALEMFLLEVE